MLPSVVFRKAIVNAVRRNYASAAVSHHHADVHPVFNDHPHAPIVTFDDVPAPHVAFQVGFQELQQKFNMLLLASVGVFSILLGYAVTNNSFGFEYGRPPTSYRNRKIHKD